MKNALNNQGGMLGGMFLWLVANLKQGVIYFIKHALPPNISAGSVRKEKWSFLNQDLPVYTMMYIHTRLSKKEKRVLLIMCV